MPFVENMDDEQKQDPNAPQQGAVSPVGNGGGAVHLSPSSAVPTVGGGGSAGPTGAAPATAGGSFASLDKYLGANQGQAEPLAGKLTSSIGNQYNTLSGQTDSTLKDINSQIAANAAPTNSADVVSQESANPVSFANDPGNVKSFQNLLNASYGGPTSAESTTGLSNQQNNINNAIAAGTAATTTEAGRENLLSQNEAAPTTGVTALNSAILSQSPTALGSVENAYKPFNNLLTNLQTGAGTADQSIAAQQAQASADNTAANNAINQQIGGVNTGAQANLDKLNTGNTNFVNTYNGLINTLANGTQALTSDQISALGLTQAQADALQQQGVMANTSQYMTGHNFGAPSATTVLNNDAYLNQLSAPVDPTINQAATPEQFQTLAALLTLNNGQLPAGALLDPTQASQAGTYVAPTLNGAFDYDKALQDATTAEQQERADAQTQANALTSAADLAHAQSQHGGGILGGITQAITHPIDTIASVSNPASWAANLVNMTKGSGPTPVNINPLKPTTANPITSSVNNLPTKVGAAAITNPTLAVGAAHGGVIPEKKEIFKNLINGLSTGAH